MKHIALICCLIATPALAQEARLVDMRGASTVLVWKNLQSLHEGQDLIQAGVNKRNPELVYGLISCIVPEGTGVIVTGRPSIGLSDILVTSGKDIGCRGTVNIESIKKE